MAASLLQYQQLLNGERAVLLFYVIRILFSIPLSLLPQAFSFSLLSLFALYVEISADDSSNPLANSFTTRAGASSGILLGSVTLPGLMVSRLIQILRAVTLQQVEIEELEYLKLQYWAAFASCFTVLVLLHTICRHQEKSTVICSTNWNSKFNFICIALLVGFGLVLLSRKSSDGLPVALMSLWVLFHGLAALKLFRKILYMFPACASIGESLLVTTGLVIYFGDMLAYTVAKIPGYFASSKALYLKYEINRSEISTIIQVYVSVVAIFVLIEGLFRDVTEFILRFTYVEAWVFQFVFSEPLKRLALCTYWLVVIYLSVRRFYNISKNSKTERILLRKYYHLMAVSIFVPALLFQPRFLNLAFGAALAVFLLLEIIRIWKIWPLGHLVHQFMNAFTDHRDSDLLIVSHFSLLLGCALPIWLCSGFTDRPLAPFAGILSLGIGDTMVNTFASMVGHKYGVLRWSKTGKKTIEGTAAGITSVLAACFVLLPLLAATGYIFTMQWFSLIIAVTISGLLEAYTAQLDNAFIPLVFYSLLCL
ncbi:hypothetical protein RD792_003541 [Penstemon davidsonii]|uniref:dolichol kinase n=1 Tax=Penstemon davidsonii TaxID=160366 RepID=A0ABR0DU07_9LAMI|nr:hypothetical protein RD792_003541 [Penstemon davidsonii]